MRIVSGLIGLGLLSLLPSLLAIFQEQLPFGADALSLFVPWRVWTSQSLHQGVLPLWNPHLFGGIPFMSNGQTSVLYPLNLIYWCLPIEAALFVDALFHSVLLGGGAFILARALSRSHAACWFCAICLMLGNAVAAHIYVGHMTWHAARAWLPWIIWALICFLQKKEGRYLWGLSLLLVLQVFAGYPPYVLWSVCWCLLFTGIWWWAAKNRSGFNIRATKPWRFFLPAVLLFLLSCAVVLPLSETSGQGRRLNYNDAMDGSSTLYSWVRLALPNFFNGNNYLQWSIELLPHEEAAYIGLLPLCLAIGSPLLWRWWRRDNKPETVASDGFQPQRFVNMLWWILPISMVMALGENMPLYRFLFEYVPPFGLFRAPARWFEIWYFAACFLAAFGLDALLRSHGKRIQSLVVVFVLLALLFGGVFIAVGNSQPQSSLWMEIAQWNERIVNGTPAERLAYAGYLRFSAVQSSVTGCFLALLTAWILYKLKQAGPARQALWVKSLFALVIAELTMMFWMSAQFVADRPPRDPWIKQTIAIYQPGERWNTAFEDYAAEFGVNLGMPAHIDLLGGYDTMAPRRFFEFANAIEQRHFWSSSYQARNYNALWKVAGVTHVLASYNSRIFPELKKANARLIARFGQGEEEFSLWELPDSWPRAFLASRVHRVPRENQLKLLREVAGQAPALAVVGEGVFPHIAAVSANRGAVKGLFSSRNIVTMQVDAKAPQVLVLSENHAPGWRAWINGRQQKIETVNYLYRSVAVPEGRSRVAFVYDNQTHRIGIFLSLCGLALLAGVLSFAANSRR